jgi:two-component system, response regulator
MTERIILFVEDNPSDVALTKRALNKSNIECTLLVAKDGQQALDMLFPPSDSDYNKLPNLILLDINLPKINGLDVLKIIRSDPRTKQIPIVVLTSSNEDKDVRESYATGANSYIRKPVDFVKFSEAIKQLGNYWLDVNEPTPDSILN